ncbi:MAG TPA: squalene synthase HpnC [Myxococcota bacterium]
MAKHRSENFPVALRVLPRATRGHLLAIYGFARLADDLGDEAPGNRLTLLDELDREIDRVFAGQVPRHPLMRQLAPTVRALSLPEAPFRRLVDANRRDQRVARYERYDQLADYCTLSANPVGHLVLGVFGAATPERIAQSDAICTALQLVEHWQDVAEDLAAGRIYLPAEDLRRFGCSEVDLKGSEATPALRRLMAFEAERARELLRRGEPLAGSLRGWARLAVAGFAAGGYAALDGIAAQDFDVLARPPRVRRRDWLRHFAALLWRTRAR